MLDLNKIVLENSKTKAIKIFREQSNLGLKEAKDIIEAAYEMKRKNPNSDANVLLGAQHIGKVEHSKSEDTTPPIPWEGFTPY